MNALIFGIGIIMMIFGVAALIVPALTKIINMPGNEKIKAIGVVIVGLVIAVYGYMYG
ncbi:MAG: hypothetical protein HXS46_11700 [Theionarchaea archaeon]|nr:hypothetical protein [Theionarchaea archaeon]